MGEVVGRRSGILVPARKRQRQRPETHGGTDSHLPGGPPLNRAMLHRAPVAVFCLCLCANDLAPPLLMAFADLRMHLRSKVHDDEPDHIGSGASTPPNGTATPRPDPTDKRLPSIVNGYFAQVRDSLRSRRKSSAPPVHSVSINPASPSTTPCNAQDREQGVSQYQGRRRGLCALVWRYRGNDRETPPESAEPTAHQWSHPISEGQRKSRR